MRVLLRAGFDTFSGYGNDGVDMALFLEEAGVDVLPICTSAMPGLPGEFTRLLTKPMRAGSHIVGFGPPYEVRPWEFAEMAPIAVGYTMWERTPFLPTDFGPRWADEDTRIRDRCAWRGLDALLVTNPMNVDAFRTVDAQIPIYVQPCGVDTDLWPAVRRDPTRRMTFLAVGMPAPRKNIFALLDVWRTLKRDMPEFDARLVVHSFGPGLHPGIADTYGPDVTISTRPIHREDMIGLYHGSDVLVSVSRGEGNNKPAMEMLASGGAVIATAWSGHMNWLHPAYSIGLPGTLEPSLTSNEALDFAVDRGALREALLSTWRDRVATSRMGEVGARVIRQMLDWSVVTSRLIRTLEGL